MNTNLSPAAAQLLVKLFLIVVVPLLLFVVAWVLVKMWGRLSSAVKDAEPESTERRRRRQLSEEAKIVILSSVAHPSVRGDCRTLRVRVRNDSGRTAKDVRIWAYCRIDDRVVFAGVSPGEDLAPGIETLREIPLHPEVKCDEVKLKVSFGQDPRKWGPWT
jgi:hypothetical protein